MEHEGQMEQIPISQILSTYLPQEEEPEPAEETLDSAEETPPEPEEPVKKKWTKKRILLAAAAGVTALALVAGILLWRRYKKEQTAPVPSGGFYLLTKATEYNADGTPGYTRKIYTYDNRGFPLSIQTDHGTSGKQVWNEDEGIYETIYEGFDGNPDTIYEYVYNEKGDILYYLHTQNKYDADGNLTGANVERNDQDQSHRYEYDLAGKITSVTTHAVQVGGGTGDINSTLRYSYDESGRIFEIWSEKDGWVFDFRYDAQGRLTAAGIHLKEGLRFYQYEYDEDGRLLRVALMGNYTYAALDDNCINTLDMDYPFDHTLMTEAQFSYNSAGDLIQRRVYDDSQQLLSQTDCQYENGQLSTVTYTNENRAKTIYRYAGSGNGSDITLVRDINGNVTRQIFPDGSYIEYEYQRFDLSYEDIQRAKNVQFILNGIDPMGNISSYYADFEGSYAFMAQIPYPTTALYQTDILRNQ